MPWLPKVNWIEGPQAHPERVALLLHGILGSARNLRSVAVQLQRARPTWRVAVADLRNHGDSLGAPPPHTVDACVDDLLGLFAEWRQEPQVVIGHSYGGKVALQLAKRPPLALRQLWVLDTLPHLTRVDDQGGEALALVLEQVRKIPQPLQTRVQLLDLLSNAGVDLAVAQWMTTNLAERDGGLYWRFDLAAVDQMLASYFATDSWPVLERPSPGLRIDVVRGERSSRWTLEVLERFAQIRSRDVQLHLLRDAGHWLHVDQPQALQQLLQPSLAGLEVP
jgi:pimeloyl-ACP methyl ester carboxylesterase